MTQNVWILADDRMGNVNQLLGVAEALNYPYTRKNIAYSSLVKLPNLLRGRSLCGLTKQSKKELQTTDFPDIVLSAGRRSFPVARWLKKHSHGKTKIVQLMNPGAAGFKEADLIVLPEHDLYKGKETNVMTVTGTPHRITKERLHKEQEKWKPTFTQYPHKRLSLIIGGATKNNPFTTEMATNLINAVKNLAPSSVLVTTSRRTPADIVEYLQQELNFVPTFFYKFGDKTENPYFGLIACADMIVVTGDSMSMCSECCATQAPVFIFAPDAMMSTKHKRFHQALYGAGYALPLGKSLQKVKGGFNPAQEIATQIRSFFPKENYAKES